MPLQDCGEGGGLLAPDSSYLVPGVIVTGETMTQGGVKIPAIVMTWTTIASTYIVYVEVEYQAQDLSTPITTDEGNAADLGRTMTSGVVAGKDYSFRYRGAGPTAYGDWSDYIDVPVPADFVASDTVLVAGMPSGDVLAAVAANAAAITDLETTFGSSAAASAAAAAAEAAQAAAEAAAVTSASDSADASTSASSAAGSATNASDDAAAAATYRDDAATYAGTAAGAATAAAASASASSGDAASASADAAAAMSSAMLSASLGGGSMNMNPGFGMFTTTPGAPDDYAIWSGAGGVFTRVTGRNTSPYALEMVVASGANVGVQQTVNNVPNGYYVADLDVTLVSGTWDGAGYVVQFFDTTNTLYNAQTVFDCKISADISGFAPGSGTAGESRKFSLLVHVPGNGSTPNGSVAIYAMGGDTAIRAVTAKTVDFNRFSWRAASQPEIDSGVAIPVLTASVATTSAAIVTIDGALATQDTTLTALGSTVTEQASAISTLDTKTASYLVGVDAAGSDPAYFQLISSTLGSTIMFAAQALAFFDFDGTGRPEKVMEIVSGAVKIVNSLFMGSSNQITLDPSVPALIFDTGSVKFVIGTNFGASSNLILWFGPSIALADMSASNATMYFDSSGDAYFGGALSAGTFVIGPATSTSLSSTASITIGPGGSKGDTKTTVASFSYFRTYWTAAGGTHSGGSTCTITLYETIAGSAETTVQHLDIVGTLSIDTDDTSNKEFTETMSGSFTYTSTATDTLDRTYRAAITAFDGVVVSGSPPTVSHPTTWTQRLGLISTEA